MPTDDDRLHQAESVRSDPASQARTVNATPLCSMVIEPPYAAARRNSGYAPAIGSILLIDCLDVRPTSAQLKPIVDAAPWCPVCIFATDRWEVRHIRRTSRVTVMFSLGDDVDGTRGILSAVATRPRPTPADMAEWVVSRTRLPALRRTLVDLFTQPVMTRTEALRLPWSVREQLALLGDWDACDWQLMWYVAEEASRRDRGAALLLEMSERAEALFGLTDTERERLAGWEWVPETALRCAGFFSVKRMDARQALGCVAVLDSVAIRSLATAGWRNRETTAERAVRVARAG